MYRKSRFFSFGAAMIAVALLFVGCSEDAPSQKTSLVDKVADTVAESLVEGFVDASLASISEPLLKSDTVATEIAAVSDMAVVGAKLYAIHDGGLIVHDMANRSTANFITAEPLYAVAYHGGKIYVGGKALYIFDGAEFEPVDMAFDGSVTELFSYDVRLMVGTDNGLYSMGIFGNETLLDEVAVSAMTADNGGVWVGTNGQGLYRWDGVDFKRRYLFRDTSLFDYVNCLDFNHDHLYVGTDSGLFIHDGGSWETLTEESGLPSSYIKSIDASQWVVYIATGSGVTSYFNGDIMPVAKLNDKNVNRIRTVGRKLIIATDGEGILVKSGPTLRTLVDPDNPSDSNRVDLFSLTL